MSRPTESHEAKTEATISLFSKLRSDRCCQNPLLWLFCPAAALGDEDFNCWWFCKFWQNWIEGSGLQSVGGICL